VIVYVSLITCRRDVYPRRSRLFIIPEASFVNYRPWYTQDIVSVLDYFGACCNEMGFSGVGWFLGLSCDWLFVVCVELVYLVVAAALVVIGQRWCWY